MERDCGGACGGSGEQVVTGTSDHFWKVWQSEAKGRIELVLNDISIKERGVTPDFYLVKLFQVGNPSSLGGGGSCRPLSALSSHALYFTRLFSCLVVGICWP